MNNEESKVVENTEETVNEEIKEEGKFKKGLKTVWRYAKKAIPAVAAGVGCFVLGRLSKGAVDVPDEIKEAVETVTENVTE